MVIVETAILQLGFRVQFSPVPTVRQKSPSEGALQWGRPHFALDWELGPREENLGSLLLPCSASAPSVSGNAEEPLLPGVFSP